MKTVTNLIAIAIAAGIGVALAFVLMGLLWTLTY